MSSGCRVDGFSVEIVGDRVCQGEMQRPSVGLSCGGVEVAGLAIARGSLLAEGAKGLCPLRLADCRCIVFALRLTCYNAADE